MTGRRLSIAIAAGIVLGFTAAADAESIKPSQQQCQQQPATVQQEAQKRQNLRARRADESPPWEGFDDCPLGVCLRWDDQPVPAAELGVVDPPE